MDKVKIVQDQLDTVIAEAGRTEKRLKSKISELGRIVRIKDSEIRRLYARLAIKDSDSTHLNIFGMVLIKVISKFGVRG